MSSDRVEGSSRFYLNGRIRKPRILEVSLAMKTYNFKVVVEPDEDFDGNAAGWHAYCPVLEKQGASTWGVTQNEAVKNINDVVRMVVESMLEHGEPIPEGPGGDVEVTVEPRVAITV